MSHHIKGRSRSQVGFEALLHPVIIDSSLMLYTSGHLRESVLNAVTAILDFIRQKSGGEDDGDRLIGQVMSINSPILVLSEIESKSGRNGTKNHLKPFNVKLIWPHYRDLTYGDNFNFIAKAQPFELVGS